MRARSNPTRSPEKIRGALLPIQINALHLPSTVHPVELPDGGVGRILVIGWGTRRFARLAMSWNHEIKRHVHRLARFRSRPRIGLRRDHEIPVLSAFFQPLDIGLGVHAVLALIGRNRPEWRHVARRVSVEQRRPEIPKRLLRPLLRLLVHPREVGRIRSRHLWCRARRLLGRRSARRCRRGARRNARRRRRRLSATLIARREGQREGADGDGDDCTARRHFGPFGGVLHHADSTGARGTPKGIRARCGCTGRARSLPTTRAPRAA